MSTAVSGPYYHTTEDTPDKVDLALLSASADEFDAALSVLLEGDPSDFAVVDPTLWAADLTFTAGDPVIVDATIRDGSGATQAHVPARANVLVDDFMLALTVNGTTDEDGRVRFSLPESATSAGTQHRFLHVTAGPLYPLVEKIVALP